MSTTNDKTERGFLRVVQYASSVSLGAMAGFLYSVKQVNPQVRFEFGLGTVVSFLLMTGVTWYFWRLLLTKHHLEGASPRDRRIRVLSITGLSVLLFAGMTFSCLRAIHTLPHDSYVDMVEGTLMAFAVLAAIGVVFWKVVSFLEKDHQRAVKEQEERHDR